MANITSWPSPAKINLFLHINGRRSDGYHELQTVFAILDYGDTINIALRDDEIIEVLPDLGFPMEQNIVYRAAMALRTYTNTNQGATITIDKHIPLGGGLGGGSSNAATTLVALNELWQLHLSVDTLATIGRKLGADVPVFVRGHSAHATGVGEILTPYQVAEKYYLVVTPKDTHVSTAEIFQHPDLPRNTPKLSIQDLSFANTHNDCEELVKKCYPNVAKTLLWLLKYAPSRMTGTGASCFVAFDTQESALRALHELPADLIGFVAKSCNDSPLLIRLKAYNAKHKF